MNARRGPDCPARGGAADPDAAAPDAAGTKAGRSVQEPPVSATAMRAPRRSVLARVSALVVAAVPTGAAAVASFPAVSPGAPFARIAPDASAPDGSAPNVSATVGAATVAATTVGAATVGAATVGSASGRALYLGHAPWARAERATSNGLPAQFSACARCHGATGEGVREGGRLTPSLTWSHLMRPIGEAPAYADAAAVVAAIERGIGRGGVPLDAVMPRFALEPHERAALLAHLRSLGGPADLPPGVTPRAVRVGTVLPLRGADAAIGQAVRDGLADAFGRANARGGVHGRRIDLVVRDAPLAPSPARAAARRLVQEGGLFALVASFAADDPSTPSNRSLTDALRERRVPHVAALAMTRRPAVLADGWVAPLLPSLDDQQAALAAALSRACPEAAGDWVLEEGEPRPADPADQASGSPASPTVPVALGTLTAPTAPAVSTAPAAFAAGPDRPGASAGPAPRVFGDATELVQAMHRADQAGRGGPGARARQAGQDTPQAPAPTQRVLDLGGPDATRTLAAALAAARASDAAAALAPVDGLRGCVGYLPLQSGGLTSWPAGWREVTVLPMPAALLAQARARGRTTWWMLGSAAGELVVEALAQAGPRLHERALIEALPRLEGREIVAGERAAFRRERLHAFAPEATTADAQLAAGTKAIAPARPAPTRPLSTRTGGP